MAQDLLSRFERVCVVCAHTDDEFGCAGTIGRLVAAGTHVRYVALSGCEESVPVGLPTDILRHECRECTGRLGIPATDVEIGNFRVRHFPAMRQEILETFVSLNRQYQPDLVLLPSSYDTHQDHATVCSEGFRAFKKSSILGYELPQNLTSFENSAFVALHAPDLDLKIRALSAYGSQASKAYTNADFVRGLALVRGTQCGAPYAEAFEVLRLML